MLRGDVLSPGVVDNGVSVSLYGEDVQLLLLEELLPKLF